MQGGCVAMSIRSKPRWSLKNKRKFQTFSSKSGRDGLQEVPNIVI